MKNLLLLLFNLSLLFANTYTTKAEGFNRVKREEFKLSFLSGLSFNTYRFSTGQYYYFTPYIYI